MGKGSKAPTPPDPRETAAAESQFNRLDTYSPSGSGVRYGYTGEDGNFQQGTAPEGMQSAVSTLESPWEKQIREMLQPASTNLASSMIDTNITNMPDQARVGDRGDIAKTIFNRNFSMMAPAIQKSNSSLIKNLQARGLPVGGEAFNDAYGEQQQRTQDTVSRMAMDADIAGGQEQSRLYGLEANQRGTALSEIAAVMGGGYNPPSAVPSGNAAGVGYSSMVNDNYKAEMGQYQQKQEQKMGIASALGSAASLFAKCTREAKDVRGAADNEMAAEIMSHIPIALWSYKDGEAPDGDGGGKHIGPMAEDFHLMTGLGDSKRINVIDYLGVLASALQSALHRIEVLESQSARRRIN
jgi:hypothetical protein